ncbi:hypothetical protein [Chryseobacterium taeanense]|uniref:hypothetical protein n=1 Tax=Chryseobacterium taeanense TaxID=311334 RepID=UPI0035AEF5FF
MILNQYNFNLLGAGNLLSTAIPHYAALPLHSGISVAIRAKVLWELKFSKSLQKS